MPVKDGVKVFLEKRPAGPSNSLLHEQESRSWCETAESPQL
jgi:hypothetical protein